MDFLTTVFYFKANCLDGWYKVQFVHTNVILSFMWTQQRPQSQTFVKSELNCVID